MSSIEPELGETELDGDANDRVHHHALGDEHPQGLMVRSRRCADSGSRPAPTQGSSHAVRCALVMGRPCGEQPGGGCQSRTQPLQKDDHAGEGEHGGSRPTPPLPARTDRESGDGEQCAQTRIASRRSGVGSAPRDGTCAPDRSVG